MWIIKDLQAGNLLGPIVSTCKSPINELVICNVRQLLGVIVQINNYERKSEHFVTIFQYYDALTSFDVDSLFTNLAVDKVFIKKLSPMDIT